MEYEIYPVQVFYCKSCLKNNRKLVYHDNAIGDCPVCGAGMDEQDFALRDNNGKPVEEINSDHPFALEMLHQSRMRTFYRAIKDAPMSTIDEMIIELMDIATFLRDQHPDAPSVRSGLIGDKLKALRDLRQNLAIKEHPEGEVELDDGPIY